MLQGVVEATCHVVEVIQGNLLCCISIPVNQDISGWLNCCVANISLPIPYNFTHCICCCDVCTIVYIRVHEV